MISSGKNSLIGCRRYTIGRIGLHTIICIYIWRIKFEWDEEKNQKNYAKHKINFELASEVFSERLARYLFDRVINGEERWRAIGRVSGHFLLLVVHCYRQKNGEEIIRIISARPAASHERRRYEEE